MTTKKIFIYGIAFILIALILVIGSILPCYLDKEFEVSGISYSTTGIIKNSVEVIDLDIASGDTVVIPESVANEGKVYTVKGIGESAFLRCDSLTSITIPNSVTSIGDRAFEECYSLTSINIPCSVTSIGKDAFWGCDGLTSINIPSSVKSIGCRAFRGCSSLTSINIPSSVTSIGYGVFYECSRLTTITLPKHITNGDDLYIPKGARIIRR